MAHNEIHATVPPDAVFDVLADARSYGHWVVGSRTIRSADPEWPAAGSVFDHEQGGLLPLLRDQTTALESRRPSLLRMRVQARPLTVAHVTLRLVPAEGGTRIEMDEVPANLRSRILMNPLTDVLIRVRNAESLRRLKRLAEGTHPRPGGPLPPRGGA